MKTYKLILILVLQAWFSSCEDLLKVTPENSVTFENAFQSEKDIVSALNATEKIIRQNKAFSYWPCQNGEYSDYYPSVGFATLNPSFIPDMQWIFYYQVIASANVSLPYIDHIDMPQEKKDFYKGQIYFFKAFTYLQIIRIWGDCILLKDDVIFTAVAKSHWTEVADYAIDLAKKAISLLPDFDQMTDYNGNAIKYKSTPSKGAANAVLAHLCAWKAGCKYMAQPDQQNYDEVDLWKTAEQACTDIIKRTDLYDLENSAEEICTKALVGNSKEIIYESMVRGFENELTSRDQAFCWGYYYQGWPVKAEENPGEIKNKSFRIYAKTVREMFPGTDERKNAFFYKLDSMQYKVSEEITGGYAYPYKWRIARVGTEGWQAGQFIDFDQNMIHFRLADIILLRAECRTRLGGKYTAGAIEDLNKVRDRSKATLYDASEYGGDLRYTIFKEREKELLMEGARYWDIIRNGYARIELQGGWLTATDQDFIDGAFFMAVSQDDFRGNPLMRQNSYWLKRQ